MPLYLLIVLIVIGMLTNYFMLLGHLKKIRNTGEGLKHYEIILSSIFFGGPLIILFYIFSDFRDDDTPKHTMLWLGIACTIIESIIIALLIYYKIICLT